MIAVALSLPNVLLEQCTRSQDDTGAKVAHVMIRELVPGRTLLLVAAVCHRLVVARETSHSSSRTLGTAAPQLAEVGHRVKEVKLLALCTDTLDRVPNLGTARQPARKGVWWRSRRLVIVAAADGVDVR